MQTKSRKSTAVKDEPIVKEVLLNAPASKVWRALTDRERMKQWYFDLAEFKPEPGFEFSFEGGTETNKYLHLCRIQEVIPEKKLSYTWRYEGYPGDSLVTFELFPEGKKTKLKLTHEGIESFGIDNPDFAKKNFETGWTEIIDSSIKNFVED